MAASSRRRHPTTNRSEHPLAAGIPPPRGRSILPPPLEPDPSPCRRETQPELGRDEHESRLFLGLLVFFNFFFFYY